MQTNYSIRHSENAIVFRPLHTIALHKLLHELLGPITTIAATPLAESTPSPNSQDSNRATPGSCQAVLSIDGLRFGLAILNRFSAIPPHFSSSSRATTATQMDISCNIFTALMLSRFCLASGNGALDVTSRAPRDECGSCRCRPF